MTKKYPTTYHVPTKEVARKLIIIALGAALVAQTACSGVMASGIGDDGRLLIYGDEASLRAWSDRDANLITNGKAESGASDTPYYQLRRLQSQPKRMKDMRRVK